MDIRRWPNSGEEATFVDTSELHGIFTAALARPVIALRKRIARNILSIQSDIRKRPGDFRMATRPHLSSAGLLQQ
jgi:hypothetical protein